MTGEAGSVLTIFMEVSDCITTTARNGFRLCCTRHSGEPYEGKPHVRNRRGSNGNSGDGLLEGDTRPERGETTWTHIACTLLRHFTTLQGQARLNCICSRSFGLGICR